MRRPCYPCGGQRPAHAVGHVIKHRYKKDGEKNWTKKLHFAPAKISTLRERFQLRVDVLHLAPSRLKWARVINHEVSAPRLFFIRELRPGAALDLGASCGITHARAVGQALNLLLQLAGHHN